MSKYTIKKAENGQLFLINAEGERKNVSELLQACSSRVVALDAPMGTGKTTLIKELVKKMGSDDIVNSPTFSIVNVYETSTDEIYHFDCYRLKDIREAIDFGAEDYLYSGNWCFIEWPDIIETLLPENTTYWKIRTIENGDREIIIHCDEN